MSHPETSFAVVAGVETYAAGANWYLDGPVSEACRFVTWLRKRGVPAEQILLFLSPLDENKALVQRLEVPAQAAEQALVSKVLTDYLPQQAGDLLLFFWGGHGVIDAAGNRRLFYADATQNNLRHLNLNNLLTSWRTDYLQGFPHQICCIDACANYVEYMRKAFSMPEETYPIGMPTAGQEQFILLATSPGELAQNQTAVKSGTFSAALLEQFAHTGPEWPPEMTKITRQLQQHFTILRDGGQAQQTPAHFWYRDWSGNEGALGTFARQAAARPADNTVQLGLTGRMELVNALLACGVIADGQTRESVIGDLRREIKYHVPRHHIPRFDIDNLVKTAIRYPGGLQELLHIVQTYEGPSIQRQELDRVVKRLLPGLL